MGIFEDGSDVNGAIIISEPKQNQTGCTINRPSTRLLWSSHGEQDGVAILGISMYVDGRLGSSRCDTTISRRYRVEAVEYTTFVVNSAKGLPSIADMTKNGMHTKMAGI
jgi:hypothetical protein